MEPRVASSIPFRVARYARDAIADAPVFRPLRRKIYAYRLAASAAPGSSFGVYGTFAEALAAVPRNRGTGYDQPAMAAMYRERLARVYANDYPVLYWLSRCMAEVHHLFDFGGHVGIHFYSFGRYLDYPPGFRWTVCDVAAVLEAGRQLAVERKASGIGFTSRFEDIEGADVLFASGSLQFLEADFLTASLRKVSRRPKHLIVNKTPVHATKQFVTLHDNGPALHPYTVFARDGFIAGIEALGYEMVDAWENPELTVEVPLFPEYDVPTYSGFYFRARS
jgi:putative methyltransferase (TIGR04325 family)